MEHLVCDTFLDGALKIWQPKKGAGYRFTLDPVLLSGFVEPCSKLLELGAGSGILSLVLLHKKVVQHSTMVEIQKDLSVCLERNIEENHLSERAEMVSGDFRSLTLPSVDAVVFNPPFFPLGESRPGKNRGRDIGRREHYGTLEDFLRCGVRVLGPKGNLYAIVRAERGKEFLDLALGLELEGVRCRHVISRQGEAPKHVLWHVRKGPSGKDLVELPPLYVHAGVQGRDYSQEVKDLLGRTFTD